MKRIPLTQGQVALVDDDDFVRLGHFKWSAHFDPTTKTFYAKRSKKKHCVRQRQTAEYLHRAVMGVNDHKVKVDHKDHDGLNCRRTNLRIATNSQNMMNRRGANRDSKTGVRGVTFQDGKYYARIYVNSKNLCLGSFVTKEEASAAYAAANRRHFGEFGGSVK